MAHDIAADIRLDPRLKTILAGIPLEGGGDVESREALLAEENTEEARKEAAVRGRKARKELAKAGKQARKEAAVRLSEMRKPGRKARKAAVQAAKSAGESKRKAKKDFKSAKKDFKAALVEAKAAAKGERKRRRWPWLLGLAVVAGGAAFAALRPKAEPPVAAEPPRTTPKPAESTPSSNGQASATSPAQKKS